MNELEDYLDFLDFGSDDFNFMTPEEEKSLFCKHEWVEAGFMHSKIVCKHCDIEKKVWESISSGSSDKNQIDFEDCD